jgi:hypothetical protein
LEKSLKLTVKSATHKNYPFEINRENPGFFRTPLQNPGDAPEIQLLY